MKRILLAVAALGLGTVAAEAGCSKSSLNGLWGMELGGLTYTVMISGGVFYFSGDKFTISSLSGSTCRGSGSYLETSGPTTYPAKFAAEASSRDANGKPNRLIAAFTPDGGTSYVTYTLTRR